MEYRNCYKNTALHCQHALKPHAHLLSLVVVTEAGKSLVAKLALLEFQATKRLGTAGGTCNTNKKIFKLLLAFGCHELDWDVFDVDVRWVTQERLVVDFGGFVEWSCIGGVWTPGSDNMEK